jgi:hypothetical protein
MDLHCKQRGIVEICGELPNRIDWWQCAECEGVNSQFPVSRPYIVDVVWRQQSTSWRWKHLGKSTNPIYRALGEHCLLLHLHLHQAVQYLVLPFKLCTCTTHCAGFEVLWLPERKHVIATPANEFVFSTTYCRLQRTFIGQRDCHMLPLQEQQKFKVSTKMLYSYVFDYIHMYICSAVQYTE